ncbi:RNA polymerase sigma factor [Amycolatopsis sp. NPDC049868]|uniref:RNA polymerase sigma factor n=1 Tax=Amycolatopsis sp. NPDC049868 TaxID=3363934 RepID=UPI00379BA5BC
MIALAAKCASGDERAWADLVQIFQPAVLTTIRSCGLTGALAEDLCQVTWLRAFQNIHKLRDPSKIRPWLVTVAKRETLRHFRPSARIKIDLEGQKVLHIRDPRFTPEEALVACAELASIREAVRALPTDHLDLLNRLFADPPQSYDQISVELGIPRGSIGPTRQRIIKRLRKDLRASHTSS